MNMFLKSVLLATAGSSVASGAIDQTELFPTREAVTVEAQCPSNCRGDFPVSSNRKYAESDPRFKQSGVARG
jgi:hypothetical protein